MDWHGCYSEGWRNEIVSEAFSHPAKFARGLIRRIYAHALERGYLQEGAVVIDPFAGVALGALDAMFHGLHFIGCELEDKFVQLGRQNIDLWNRCYGNGKLRRWGTATILQGDSRRLCEVLEGARVEGIIASPPFESVQGTGSGDLEVRQGRTDTTGEYGQSEGQLGNMPTGEPPQGIVQVDACVSSPPWYGTTPESGDPNYAHKFHGDQSKYAESTTSLYNELTYMSPEWIERRKEEAKRQGNISRLPAEAVDPDYPTFWKAARAILLQCHAVLAPGGVAIWVLKAFVRNKAIVDFPGQWRALCEACGFETIEVIRAWLVEDRGAQFALNGDLMEKKVARKSFFRRLHEKKYPDLAIDYEIVLITKKGAA